MNEWSWWWGEGSECERYFPANSRDDAIEQAIKRGQDNYCVKMTICEGRREDFNDVFISGNCVWDDWVEHNNEVADEDGELGDAPTHKQFAELEDILNATFKEWRERHKLGQAWALETRNCETIEIALPKEPTP